ncbi:nucleotide disphospho-sugar-binding domain-containing protein [Bradyrhizobium sp. Ai1a-2]|uniref:glycosyltransferase n=1 Tax=Bradyrhizobium sp. Ai1a-2 TaxID=196490 RepID=UPI0031B808EC
MPAADIDTRNAAELFPEIRRAAPGAQQLRLILEQGFADFMLPQYESIETVMREFPPDIIIGDHLMLGVLPMLLGPRAQRPPVALLGTTYLLSRRDDGAPNDAGIPPARNDQQQREYAALFQTYEQSVFGPAGRCVNEYLAQIGSRPLRLNLYDAMVELPDIYLQLTVPRFELSRRRLPGSVHFVGPLPITPNQAPVPSWAYELDGSRKVVLVTQGTLTNNDFSELVLPTVQALANEPDVLVMVTTGGRSIDALSGTLPGNVRVAQYLPFEWALSKADAFVTNGGYGSVNQALSYGVPIVVAGTGGDRGDVSVRIAWSGVGINLATSAPTAEQLRPAVRSVLDDPKYRERAASLADDIRKIDTAAEIRRILREPIATSSQDRPRAKKAARR